MASARHSAQHFRASEVPEHLTGVVFGVSSRQERKRLQMERERESGRGRVRSNVPARVLFFSRGGATSADRQATGKRAEWVASRGRF